MESSPSQDLTDTHDTLSTLDYIVHFLHTEGFYAAEEALLREIENRYPECEEHAVADTGVSPSARSAKRITAEDSGALSDVAPPSGRSGEWQQTLQAIQSAGSRKLEETTAQTPSADILTSEGGTSLHSQDVDAELDEYSDNDDPGYRRQDIRGQEAFIAQELDLSDDEASHRGPTDFHSPSKTLHELDSSSARDSSYMAEPAGTSAYGSEAVSEMSNGTQQPRMSGPLLPQQLSITLKPGMADASLPDQDTGHLLALDTQRSDQSADSSVSLTVTDKSRADPDEHVSSSQGGEAVSAAAPTGTSLVHQQSGFRHILDGMLEKVSDAFARHSPRGGEQAHEGSECSDASSSDAGDMPPDEQAGGMPTLRTHRRAPKTPVKAQSSAGDLDSENFSFPVTPPSEPAPAGPVFGHGFGRASSGVSHGESEYTNDGRDTNPSPSGTSRSDVSPQQLSVGGKSGRHRTLIDVIQDLEQENAEEEGSTGLSPANERPVPLDLSCAISDPVPMQEACSNASAGTEGTSDQQSHPVKVPTEAELSGNNQSMPPPPGLDVIPDLEVACPADDEAVPAQIPPSPHPSGWNGPSTTNAEADQETESDPLVYDYDQDYVDQKYEQLSLKVVHRRGRTGFEETKDFPVRVNDLVAGRYQVMDFLGSAAFSKAVQALDTKTGMLVCLKIIKNNKDYFDQSLDEIKLLKYINEADPDDEHGMLRLFDYFYYKEHLFLVCELLRANLYEFQKYNRENGDEPYFTLPHLQRIAQQVLRSIAFLHSLNLIHSDLKPENILVKSYSRCEVKVIDLGSSCFTSDHLSSYVQSRSYRAPEVILGLPYDQKIDIWSFGCILAELLTGTVLFQNDSLATLLARLEGILEPIPNAMIRKGRFSHRFYTRQGRIYERSQQTGRYEFLTPKDTNLRHRLHGADDGFINFVQHLLAINPADRPTAESALQHPWLQVAYEQDS